MTRRPFSELPPATQAGILCGDERFQRFVASQIGFSDGRATPTATTEYLRQWCGITSRINLATNREAREKLETLRTEFDAWTGKIPSQR